MNIIEGAWMSTRFLRKRKYYARKKLEKRLSLIMKTDSEVNNDVQGSNITIDNCHTSGTNTDCAYEEAEEHVNSEFERERENEIEPDQNTNDDEDVEAEENASDDDEVNENETEDEEIRGNENEPEDEVIKLRDWIVNRQVPHAHADMLLDILRPKLMPNLPKFVRKR